MVRFLRIIPLMFIACALSVTAALAECKRERFHFRGVYSGSSLVYFRQLQKRGLEAGEVRDVYRPARVCDKTAPKICLDLGGVIGVFFSIPKAIIENEEYTETEWSEENYKFKLNFRDNGVFIVDSYLIDHNMEKIFSFYYSIDHGLLSISRIGKENIIVETYVSTCPGFLALE